jgi:hypothetical protein
MKALAVFAWLLTAVDRPVSVLDTNGGRHTPAEFRAHNATVLVFVEIDCPLSNTAIAAVDRLAVRFATRDARFFAVYSDPQITAARALKHTSEFAIRFAALLDPDLALARWAGARTTPEAVVVSRAGEILYRGRIDDRTRVIGETRTQARRNDLAVALDEILGRRPVTVARTKAVGCAIPYPPQVPEGRSRFIVKSHRSYAEIAWSVTRQEMLLHFHW